MQTSQQINIENYRDLLHYSPLGIFTATLKGRYIEVNETLARLLGYDSSQDLLELIDISHEIYATKGEREKIIKQLQAQQQIISHETSFKRKDGSLVAVRITYKLITSNQKEQFVVGLVEDISEQLSRKNAIIDEKQTLLTLIEKIPDYVYLKNKEGEILIANKAVRLLIEQKKSSNKVSKEPIANELFEGDLELLKSGGILSEKLVEITTQTGIKDYLSLSKYPIFDDRNNLSGLIGIGRNLTDLKQAERQIIKSQSNLSALIESSNDLIWSVDSKLNLITYNTAFAGFIESLHGNKVNVGDNILNVFNNTDKDFWKNCYANTSKGEKQLEEISYTLNGNARVFECSFNPIFDRVYKLTGISVILTDISERRMTEQAIRESEERFRQLAENTSDAFILWDNKGLLYANPSFEKIFGIRIEEATKDFSIIEKLIDENDRKRFIRNRKKEISGKLNTRNQQYLLRKNRRTTNKIWARHYPVYNIKGKIYRYVTVTSDITEQRNLEEVLTATRSQQQALLDNIPFLVWLKDKNGRYISINQPFCNFYQMKPEDIIGKTDYEILPLEIAKQHANVDREVLTSGERKHIEDFRKTLHGEEWIEIYKSPIFNEKGAVIGLTGISREITDRKRLEEAIKKNEEHFRALLQYSSDAITILDINGDIIFESSLRNRILNFSIEELVGKPFREIIHPEDIWIYEEALSNSIANPGVQIKKEYRSLHKNKRWIYVESIFTNHINNPSISGIVVNTRDVSDRKMAELKERAYHSNLIFLSNSALELLSLSDKEDIYKYIGNTLSKFLENSVVIVSAYHEQSDSFVLKNIGADDKLSNLAETIIGRSPIGLRFKRNTQNAQIENAGTISTILNIPEFVSSHEDPSHKIQSLLEGFKVNKIYTITLARHNKLLGNISIVMLNKTIIKFKHIIETFAHQVAVALHRSQLEFELVSAKMKAEESDRLKTAFLANMSHEIRTPMNGILGFAEMLNDVQLSAEERKKYLDIINNNGKILINLIDDIIDFAKIEAGQVKIMYHDFSLNALLSQIYNSLLTDRLKREKSEVKLRLKKEFDDENSFINCDPNRLRQIITNLLGNAIKFTNSGHIEFGYSLTDSKELKFYVTDTGIGIAPDKLDQIFDRFIQADNSRSRKYSGSGLGLAISKGFVELLGGRMWAESEVTKGASFYFTIPYKLAKTRLKERNQKRKPKSEYNWSGKKFLIAEDDFFSFKFLEGFLKQTKAEILHADDGKKAVNMCVEDDSIDIILMDVQMPEMNGMDATRNIKKIRKSLPIIAQTANAIAEEKQKCFEAGFDDFVTKPINITELFMKIDHWLTRSET
jgi:PAS domain S-box-containing protein